MEKRYVGVDLHRNQFTVCVRLENGRTDLREWRLGALPQFVKKLRTSDEVAVEATGNTRLFYDAVQPHVARVVVVATNQFRVITQWVTKTDANDARLLALYLAEGIVAGGAHEGPTTRPDRQPNANPGRAGEAAHRAEEQGE
jgi:transposase